MNPRIIVVDGLTYTWRAGPGTVEIRGPAEIRFQKNRTFDRLHSSKLLGVTPDVFERGQWKKTSDGMITPRAIRDFIAYHPCHSDHLKTIRR